MEKAFDGQTTAENSKPAYRESYTEMFKEGMYSVMIREYQESKGKSVPALMEAAMPDYGIVYLAGYILYIEEDGKKPHPMNLFYDAPISAFVDFNSRLNYLVSKGRWQPGFLGAIACDLIVQFIYQPCTSCLARNTGYY